MSTEEFAESKNSGKTIYEALIGQIDLADTIRAVRKTLFLVPSCPDLVGAEMELPNIEGSRTRLKDLLGTAPWEYNVVLIDTPPSLGILTLNALVAADSVLVPVQCEYYAMEGLTSLHSNISRIKASLNPSLEIEGVLLTMFDSRNRLSREVESQVRGSAHFAGKVFTGVIPRNVRLSESPSYGLSVLEYEAKSSGAESYRRLAAELLAPKRWPQQEHN
jgi:chromosome partitioning protein